uniref:Uncharacterized protein n=1 Tax=Plectus sambesii TaxID=2011161 RepID=A0A914WH76_9BILA
MNSRTQEVWDSLANSERLFALATVLAALTKKHPYLACVIGSIFVCNFIPLVCFIVYSLFAAIVLFSIAAVVQCVALGMGLCFLLPCMGLATCFGFGLSLFLMASYSLLQWFNEHYPSDRCKAPLISSVVRKEHPSSSVSDVS